MKRRDFLRIGGAGVIGPALAPVLAHGAAPEPATVLYDDRSVTLADTEFQQATAALWVRAIDFPVFNVADICITVAGTMLALSAITELLHKDPPAEEEAVEVRVPAATGEQLGTLGDCVRHMRFDDF